MEQAVFRANGGILTEVSTPHGRAVPVERRVLLIPQEADETFQPLMGEPSLWNPMPPAQVAQQPPMFQPLMGEPSLWNLAIAFRHPESRLVSTPHGRAVPVERSVCE